MSMETHLVHPGVVDAGTRAWGVRDVDVDGVDVDVEGDAEDEDVQEKEWIRRSFGRKGLRRLVLQGEFFGVRDGEGYTKTLPCQPLACVCCFSRWRAFY
jgi:hypothetical protein